MDLFIRVALRQRKGEEGNFAIRFLSCRINYLRLHCWNLHGGMDGLLSILKMAILKN